MNINFVDADHKTKYDAFCKMFGFNTNDRDYVLLFYLLASIASESIITDLVVNKGDGIVGLRLDALSHGWVTSGDAAIIRLAFHFFTYETPTANDMNGLKAYLPMNILTCLDRRLTVVALESFRMFCYWF